MGGFKIIAELRGNFQYASFTQRGWTPLTVVLVVLFLLMVEA